ncbi:MAG: YybS family protein [Deltaproteobacteria bacterium]|nr:YybS family protein [Deltaproteobacteria bacterium]
MSDEKEGLTSRNHAIKYTVLFALIVLLPGMQGAVFGWMYFFVPLAVFFYLYKWKYGTRFVLAGLLIAAPVSLALSSFGTLISTATLVPAGYILAQSAFQGDSPTMSGIKGTIVLASCWLVLLIGQTIVTGINPISDFLSTIDVGVEAALEYYRQSDSMTPDTMVLLEQSFYQMKEIMPKVMPSIILGLSLLIIWFTMLSGNVMVRRVTGYQPWAEHRTWQLPDKVIWPFIGSALVVLLPLGAIRVIGVNALISLSLVYFFQGFSILVFFMHKWKVPLLLRAFFYGMMLFQSFGTILLLIVGIGDVWLDIRRIKPQDTNDSPDDKPS